MSLDKSRRNGISSWCKECRKDNARKWKIKYPVNADKARLKRIENYKQAPPTYQKQREMLLKHRYGITSSDYDNLLKFQNYSCAICNKNSKEMTYLLHVDHCHASGQVRGLLCSPCNTYLGSIKDNPNILLNAINYLKGA